MAPRITHHARTIFIDWIKRFDDIAVNAEHTRDSGIFQLVLGPNKADYRMSDNQALF
jgi:hypothetical protein